jgi:hypothetical protein
VVIAAGPVEQGEILLTQQRRLIQYLAYAFQFPGRHVGGGGYSQQHANLVPAFAEGELQPHTRAQVDGAARGEVVEVPPQGYRHGDMQYYGFRHGKD